MHADGSLCGRRRIVFATDDDCAANLLKILPAVHSYSELRSAKGMCAPSDRFTVTSDRGSAYVFPLTLSIIKMV